MSIRRRLARLDFYLVATLVVYVLVMLLVGSIIGSGYSFSMKEVVILPYPMRISVDNYTDSILSPLVRVWGRAYTRELVVAEEEPIELVKPLVSGNLTCSRVVGTEYLYKCRGRGYVYKFAGILSEFVERGNTSRYFYYGSGIRILVYSYDTAVFGTVISQVVVVLYSYSCRTRFGEKEYKKYRWILQAAGVASLATGAVSAVREHPWFLGPIRGAIILLVVVAVAGAAVLPVVVEKLYNWVESRRS